VIAYRGVRDKAVRMAMKALEDFGSIERTGETVAVGAGKRAILWRLAA